LSREGNSVTHFAGIKPVRGVPFLIVAFLVLLLLMSYSEVNAGTIGVVKRLGKPVSQLSPGAHLIRPITDTVTPISVQTKIVKPSEDASSHDLQVVHTEVTLAYHIDPNYATYVLVSLNEDAENRVIIPAILEAIKATTAQYDAQDLISRRPVVRDAIEAFVKARLEPYHVIAETTSITDFHFSNDYENAIEAKVTASQLAEKAQNDLARIKIEADQKVAAAEGEAKALEAQKSQITPELIQLRTIEMLRDKWDGRMPTVVSGNGGVPMLDLLRAAGQK
jgi:prohibitin 2